MKLLLDTNTLLLFGQGIDVFSESASAGEIIDVFLVPDPVIRELETLAMKASADGRAAKLALALVKEKERRSQQRFLTRLLIPTKKEIPLKIIPSSGTMHTDDAIMRIAEDDPVRHVVATLDKGLQRRLLNAKVRVLGVRGKQFRIIA